MSSRRLLYVSYCISKRFWRLELYFGYVSDLGCLTTCVYLHCGIEQWVKLKSAPQNDHIRDFGDPGMSHHLLQTTSPKLCFYHMRAEKLYIGSD